MVSKPPSNLISTPKLKSINSELKHGNTREKKRKFVAITEQFEMKKSEVSGVTKTSAVCIHCQKVTQRPETLCEGKCFTSSRAFSEVQKNPRRGKTVDHAIISASTKDYETYRRHGQQNE